MWFHHECFKSIKITSLQKQVFFKKLLFHAITLSTSACLCRKSRCCFSAMDPLSTMLKNSFGKLYPIAGTKKRLIPFRAEACILSEKLLSNSWKPNNTETFISDTLPTIIIGICAFLWCTRAIACDQGITCHTTLITLGMIFGLKGLETQAEEG